MNTDYTGLLIAANCAENSLRRVISDVVDRYYAGEKDDDVYLIAAEAYARGATACRMLVFRGN